MMFCLDTNTIIHFFKGMGRVPARLLATPPSDICVPAIVLYELQFGVLGSANPEARRRQLELFLASTTVVPFSEKTALAAALIRRRLESIGKPIGPLDTLIAATAISYDATLVTHNMTEFSRVPSLRVVDWF
jgi:tRNA(fMet)-specific endonuclease VapC